MGNTDKFEMIANTIVKNVKRAFKKLLSDFIPGGKPQKQDFVF